MSPKLPVIANERAPLSWQVETDHQGGLIVQGPELNVMINATGQLTYRYRGQDLLKESKRSFPQGWCQHQERSFHGVQQDFTLSPREALYGLGQFPDGVMNWRGQQATLLQNNKVAVVPFWSRLLAGEFYGIIPPMGILPMTRRACTYGLRKSTTSTITFVLVMISMPSLAVIGILQALHPYFHGAFMVICRVKNIMPRQMN